MNNTNFSKWILIVGGLFCLTTVLIGAFASHGLKNLLDDKALGWIDTGVFYQSFHGLALIACGLISKHRSMTVSVSLFIAGICLFCGSLYAMALTGNTQLGVVTPMGGVCFILGWLSFCWSVRTL